MSKELASGVHAGGEIRKMGFQGFCECVLLSKQQKCDKEETVILKIQLIAEMIVSCCLPVQSMLVSRLKWRKRLSIQYFIWSHYIIKKLDLSDSLTNRLTNTWDEFPQGT